MNTAQFQALRTRNTPRPVDIFQAPELDDSEIMATVAAVAADPAMLSYDELVAAAVAADDNAAWQLMNSVMVIS